MRGKKLQGNGLWESSRIMINQHVEAIRDHRREIHRRVKPELDEQRLEELSFALNEAMESRSPIRITTFGPFGDESVEGIVESIDPMRRRVKLRTSDEVMYILFGDIVGVG